MEAGTTLKHYRILSRLGEGGMGVVYRAEDTRLGRSVALKVFPPGLELNEERLTRFKQEARAASSISHPGVATLYDFDHEGPTTFLTMEYVEGKNLRQILEQGPLPFPRLLNCLTQVAEALAAAHRQGVIHRDLKPENVMAADSGYYKILDFGLARMELKDEADSSGGASPTQVATVSRALTGEGKILGTIAYMSPEQVQGMPMDARSDIFSFGTLLYELATGRSPFEGHNALATFHAIVHEAPRPMPEARQDVPGELERIAAKCLAKDPSDRYQTAADLAVDLRALRRDSDSGVRSPYVSRPRMSAPGLRRPRAAGWWFVTGGVLLALAAGTLWLWPGRTGSLSPGLDAQLASSSSADRNRIVVAFFSNRTGDSEADWLGHGLPEMLTTDLAGAGGLEVVSTQRLYDLLAAAGREDVDSLDRSTATQLARWAGAGVVVSGTIFKSGTSYRIDVQAYDTSTGQVLTASRVQGSDIFKMADELAAALLRGLNISGAGEDEGLHTVTTSSPEAYRLYSGGMKLYADRRFAEAIDLFRQSLTHDADFVLSGLRLGMSLFLSGRDAEGLPWIRQAAESGGRIPQRERLLAEGIHAHFGAGNHRIGEQRLQEMTGLFPQDVEGYFWRAKALSSDGDDLLGAIRMLHRALEVDPNDALVVGSLAGHLEDLGLEAEADAILQDFLERKSAPMVP